MYKVKFMMYNKSSVLDIREFADRAEAIQFATTVDRPVVLVENERNCIIWGNWFNAEAKAIDIPARDFDYRRWQDPKIWEDRKNRRRAERELRRNRRWIEEARAKGEMVYMDKEYKFHGVHNLDLVHRQYVESYYGGHYAFYTWKVYWDQTIADVFQKRKEAEALTARNYHEAVECGNRFYKALAPMNPTNRRDVVMLWADRERPGHYYIAQTFFRIQETYLRWDGFKYEWSRAACGEMYDIRHYNKVW